MGQSSAHRGQCYSDDDEDGLRRAPAETAAGAWGLSGPSEAALAPTVRSCRAAAKDSWRSSLGRGERRSHPNLVSVGKAPTLLSRLNIQRRSRDDHHQNAGSYPSAGPAPTPRPRPGVAPPLTWPHLQATAPPPGVPGVWLVNSLAPLLLTVTWMGHTRPAVREIGPLGEAQRSWTVVQTDNTG